MKHNDAHSNGTTGELQPLPTKCGNITLVTLTAGVEVKVSSHIGSSNQVWYALINGSESK